MAISTAFIAQYGAEVKQAFQQKKSKLMDAVRVHRGVRGSTYTFPTLAKLSAVDAPAYGADISSTAPTHGTATATLADKYAPVYVKELELLKTNIDAKREYVMGTVATMNRFVDQNIVATLDAATMASGHEIAADFDGDLTNEGLTLAKIKEASRLLNKQDVEPEDRFLVISPDQLDDALGVAQLTSSDYMVANTLNGIREGSIKYAFGFNWIMSNELNLNVNSGGATVRACYAFSKTAVGVALGQEIESKVDWVPQKVSWLINSKVSLGSTMIEDAGIVRIQTDEA